MAGQVAQTIGADESEPREATFRDSLVRTPEGRLLLVGLGITMVCLAWLAVSELFSDIQADLLLGMAATEIVLGRAAALAVGYSSDLGHAPVIGVCIVVETLLVLLFYPLFVFSYNSMLSSNRLHIMFQRVRARAESHKEKVQRYGIVGLFVFVWLPFWMTGPVVGCVIGFLLGLRTWVNISVVLAGTYVAILGWAFFLRGLQERLAAYGPYAGAAIVIALVCAFFLLQRMRQKINGNRNGR